MRFARFGALISCLLLAVTLTSGTASAQVTHRHEIDHPDARHDIRSIDHSGAYRAAPTWQDGDITRVRAVYGAHNVSVAVYFAKLGSPSTYDSMSAELGLTDPSHARSLAEVSVGAAHPHGQVSFSPGHTVSSSCRIQGTVSYAHKEVHYVIPTRCLAYPAWVRLSFRFTELRDKNSVRIDDAFTGGTPSYVPQPVSVHLYRP